MNDATKRMSCFLFGRALPRNHSNMSKLQIFTSQRLQALTLSLKTPVLCLLKVFNHDFIFESLLVMDTKHIMPLP